MKVIVCGAGQVGANIARELARENNDVTVIDNRPEAVNRLAGSYDLRAIVGWASLPDVLEQAGAAESDMLIAVTHSDEVNMVACQVAHSLFRVPTKIARVRHQGYLKPHWRGLYADSELPIDTIISPEMEVARSVERQLSVPGTIEVVPFCDDRVRLVGTRLDENCPILNTPLKSLTELFPGLQAVVVGIRRNEALIVPSDEDMLLPGDEVHFVASTDHVGRAMALFGHEEAAARHVLIAGAGNIGSFLAEQIEAEHPNVRLKILESSAARAEAAADRLSRTVVLKGDALDIDLLREAGAATAETLVALTNDDETNILVSLLAKRLGCRRVVTLVNNPVYEPLLPSLGIDVAFNPRATTVSTILTQVRRGRIKNLYSVGDGSAEAVEAEALATSPLVGKPLRDVALPDGMIIGAIVRGPKVILPRGGTVVEAKDRVVMFALKDRVKALEKLFAVRLEFF